MATPLLLEERTVLPPEKPEDLSALLAALSSDTVLVCGRNGHEIALPESVREAPFNVVLALSRPCRLRTCSCGWPMKASFVHCGRRTSWTRHAALRPVGFDEPAAKCVPVQCPGRRLGSCRSRCCALTQRPFRGIRQNRPDD